MRIETDFLGERQIPENALYGIHSLRAKENFPDQTPFPIIWYQAMGSVKLACYQTYRHFAEAVENRGDQSLKLIPVHIINALEQCAKEVAEGQHFDFFIVPAIQGGAGTSINMNVNEIIANRALILLKHQLGHYDVIDPIEQANIYQSTNDVVPTALKLAVLQQLNLLEISINLMRSQLEALEKEHRFTLRIGFTQMQEAVPTTYGRLFSTYADALTRDWWRVSKCFERIKEVNLGGGAIGSGMAIPRYFIMNVVQKLRQITNLPFARSENLQDTTSNLDSFTEVHAILKAHAVNLEKMVSDMRLLSSDLRGTHELIIPQLQVGSSIMPGKINPVIPEYVVSVSHKVYSNDMLVTSLCASGCLELNPYLPLIGISLLDSLNLLITANQTILNHLFTGLIVDSFTSAQRLYQSPSVTTALSPYIGYHKASLLAKEMKLTKCSVFEANKIQQLMEPEKLKQLLSPEQLLKLGFTLDSIA